MSNNSTPVRILGFAGSLRGGSYNRALLHAAHELAPEGVEIETFDLAPIPLYNADLDTDAKCPEPVERFKETIGNADGLLVVTPEYNHGVPGVLKNAVDWASRPGRNSVLKGKPAGIMGASPGAIGTARAQEHLKQILEAPLAHVMPHPGVLVGGAKEKFGAEGRLTDEATRSFVEDYLQELAGYVRRFSERKATADYSA